MVQKRRIKGATLLLLATLLAGAGIGAGGDPQQGEYKPEELVCKMMPGFSIDVINNAYGTTVRNHQPETDCYLLTTPPGADAESLAVVINTHPGVEYCGANYYLDAPEPLQRSSAFLDLECVGTFPDAEASATLNLATVQDITLGTDIKIAVIDGGVNLTHPVFADKSAGLYSGWDYIDGDSVANDEPGGSGSGHGTFVAGIVKTVSPDADIYAYRVLDTTGRGNGYDIASAILRAIDDGCRVINLSLGMIGKHDALDDALRYAEWMDIVVVAAAGNDSTCQCNLIPFPATKNYCLAVAALDTLNRLADFSNYGEKIDLCAPGTGIYSSFTDTLFAWWDGTSFSAPFVTGLVALMYSVSPDLTWESIHNILCETAVNIDSVNPGFEGTLGCGMVDMVAALQTASSFMCGDANASGNVDIADAVHIINYIFKHGAASIPVSRSDANGDGNVNIGDAVYIVRFVFFSGPAPCAL